VSALTANTSGFFNTALGFNALSANDAASDNTAVGYEALKVNVGGADNTAVGQTALNHNTSGSANTAVGVAALRANTTGTGNVAIGTDAGLLANAPSTSIFIRNTGAAADTLTIKIGTEGTQLMTFIAGIRGKTTGQNNAAAVLIDSNGQLGTVSSSRRYKEDIQPMGDMSEMLAKLRPVMFRYKKPFDDGSKPIQYGLIAEEVAEAFPYLAVFNADGQPETVAYHQLPTFLLAGFQEQQRVIAAQAEQLARQQVSIEALRERVRVVDTQQERIVALEDRLRSIEAQPTRPSITAASDSP
jgi:hypothetical protein